MNKSTLRLCNRCGWAHFSETRREVEAQAREFGDYINAQPAPTQAQFGYGPLADPPRNWSFTKHVERAERCFSCGNPYTDFRGCTDADRVPQGVTLQGIMCAPDSEPPRAD